MISLVCTQFWFSYSHMIFLLWQNQVVWNEIAKTRACSKSDLAAGRYCKGKTKVKKHCPHSEHASCSQSDMLESQIRVREMLPVPTQPCSVQICPIVMDTELPDIHVCLSNGHAQNNNSASFPRPLFISIKRTCTSHGPALYAQFSEQEGSERVMLSEFTF